MDQAIPNAIMITRLMSEAHFTPSLIDEIERAAIRLSAIEEADDFDWGQAPRDWESVCEWISVQIVRQGRSPLVEEIRNQIYEN